MRAVDGVSFAIDTGEMVALYGPSGSGKSTLLNVIATILPADAGAVLVGGRDVTRLVPRAAADYRRLELGYVRQVPELLAGADAVDNAALKLFDSGIGIKKARRQVLDLLDRLGLEGRHRHMPHELSVGERQQVLIARALSTGPRVVLADEPTGALDTDRSREVLALLAELCTEHQVAMLLATHDPLAASYADRAITLRDGKLVEPDRATQGERP